MSTQTFSIQTFELGPMDNFIYLIQDKQTHQAAVLDPAWEIREITQAAKQQQLQITDVLLTHAHYDHINGLMTLLRDWDAQVHISKKEAEFIEYKLSDNMVLHEDEEVIHLGNTKIKIWHMPGHTPGSVCYDLGRHLFTGDTLFVGGCGRCNLRGGDATQLYHSLKKLAHFPSDILIYPGHNYGRTPTSTLAEQVATNPFMQFNRPEKFVQYRNRPKF